MRKLAQSTSPSPKFLPAALPPSFDSKSPPAPISKLPNESNSTATATSLTPKDITDPDQLIDPPLPKILPPPLAPTLQASPPPQPANSPPATTGSPPSPPTTSNGPPPASSPPLVPESPPPDQTLSPPSIPSSPPPSSPPPPPTDATLSPPAPSPPSPPPKDATSPPPSLSTPPSPPAVPPPKSSPPSPQVIPPPPSPAKRPKSPPPSRAPPPKVSPSPPSPPPPNNSLSAPPPTVISPPPGPLSPWPLPSSPRPPTTNTSVVGVPPTSQLPLNPKEKKPTDWATNDTGVPASTSSKETGGLSSGGSVAISVVVVFVVLGLIATVVFFVRKRKRRGSKPTLTLGYPAASPFGSPHNSGSYLLRPPASLKGTNYNSNFIQSSSEQGGLNNSMFTYEELAHATDWFSADNELGEGGFGKVYKGVLADGREVAVKQLKAGGGQGEREFRAEVEIISRIHHRHLVSLVGYCVSERQRLLVYDFVPNNTLHYHLHGVGRPVLEWSIRVKVAAGAARGLAYLHEDCNPRIIHRDIKSANILLDNNYEAKVADFGLAKLAMELESQTHVSTRVMGTFGYMAPEYATTGKLTEKSDVYSFGVVLLELITGHRPVDDSGHLGDESLVEWARPRLLQALESEVFDQLVDPRLERNYIASEMFRIVEAAAACVRHQASRRPKMSQVVRALDSIGEETGLSNGMRFGQSEVIDSAEHSAQIKKFQRMAFGSGSTQDYTSSYISHSQSSWRT